MRKPAGYEVALGSVSAGPYAPQMVVAAADRAQETRSHQTQIWIDGVGTFLLCWSPRFSIGGPAGARRADHLTLLADLKAAHADIVREGDVYYLQTADIARINELPAGDSNLLKDGDNIQLGANVQLRFRTPHPLCASACLDFLSDHRPAYDLDGVVLLDEVCLLGPGSRYHIDCRTWDEEVLLFRRDETLWCRSQRPFEVSRTCESAVQTGSTVSGADFRFRIEGIG